MGTAQLEYSWDELLADPPLVEPLRAGGLVCHGGFNADGVYESPRTLFRVPALQAWQEHHRETVGGRILDAPLDAFPGAYPNLDQARLLLRDGVRDPIVASLTRIGTVEGFGAMIRYLAPENMQRFFAEDIRGTATAHLGRGLVEAHARDEAGWEDQAGHNRMWFAVRDIAFENPVTTDETAAMLERMGIGGGMGGSGGASASDDRAARFAERRRFPDLDVEVEMLISTMARVLFIEIKAFHIFRWAEALLSDDELVAGEGEAARVVSYIRADETPHVDYLRTSLSEMHDRTFVGLSGRRIPGSDVVRRIWDQGLEESMGVMEEQSRASIRREVELALSRHKRGADVLAEFDGLAVAA
jgi:hypothetical protein